MKENIRYQKELQQIFLVKTNGDKSIINGYQGQVITRNKLKNLADCRIHFIDGDYEVWYDISSCQSLEQAFAIKELVYEDLLKIICCVMQTISEIENYLIDSKKIIFDPELIFINLKTDTIRFLLDFTEAAEGFEISKLGDFFIERTCHEDEKAVDLSYFFFECSSKNTFSVSDMEKYMATIAAYEQEEKKDPELEYTEKNDIFDASKPMEIKKAEYKKEYQFSWNSREGIIIEGGLSGAVLSVLFGIAFLVIQNFYLLEFRERFFWIAGCAFLFLVSSAITIYGVFIKRKMAEREKETDNSEKYFEKTEEVCLLEPEQQERCSVEEEEEEKTVYVGKALLNKEHFLIEIKRGKEISHSITAYPFFIGKDKERVHLQLNDRSVSRIHAKLYNENGDIFLEDLHSTNGTYLNDLILTPHEKIRLQRGDSIMLGKAEVIFR